jgi:hypothetical protein
MMTSRERLVLRVFAVWTVYVWGTRARRRGRELEAVRNDRVLHTTSG